MELEIDDDQTFGPNHLPSPWVRGFTLGLRAHDPRFEWYPIRSEVGNASGATVICVNDGNAHADLTFDVHSSGDPMEVTLQNLTLGRALVFAALPIASDELFHVTWRQRAAVSTDDPPTSDYSPNTDMMPYMDLSASDWWNAMEWGLGPGSNSIRVTGTNIQSWDVYWQHTSY